MAGFLEYGRFRINLINQVLYENETEVKVEPLPFRMFQFFMENVERTIPREELEDTFGLSPESIATALTKIRKILGEDAHLLDGRVKIGWRLKQWNEKYSKVFVEVHPSNGRLAASVVPNVDASDPSSKGNSGNTHAGGSSFILSMDSIILNSVGELVFGFVSDFDIAECRSSYERALEDFAFALVYGSELRAKWVRRDPRQAPKDKLAEPAEFLLWSFPDA